MSLLKYKCDYCGEFEIPHQCEVVKRDFRTEGPNKGYVPVITITTPYKVMEHTCKDGNRRKARLVGGENA